MLDYLYLTHLKRGKSGPRGWYKSGSSIHAITGMRVAVVGVIIVLACGAFRQLLVVVHVHHLREKYAREQINFSFILIFS